VRPFLVALVGAPLLCGCSATLQLASCAAPDGNPTSASLVQSAPRCQDVKQRDGSILRTCDDGVHVTVQKIGAIKRVSPSDTARSNGAPPAAPEARPRPAKTAALQLRDEAGSR